MGMTEDQMPPMGQDEDMPPKPADDKDESMSIFIPKEFMMGKTFKAGDVMEVKIVDIDPETGDAEGKYNTGDDKEQNEAYGPTPSESGFDKAMPEKE